MVKKLSSLSFIALIYLMIFASAIASFIIHNAVYDIFPKTSGNLESWGHLGDFFGGTFNTIFSFIGLILLLVTLIQNQKELELSREELAKSSKALIDQVETSEKQRFENTLFALLDQLNRFLDRLLSQYTVEGFNGYHVMPESSVDILKSKLLGYSFMHSLLESASSLTKAKEILLTHDPLLNQYFRILYQILKLISTNSPHTALHEPFSALALENNIHPSETEKFYANLVRSCVPENVYYLLAVNCFVKDKNDPYYPYRLLIERYEFFEHCKIMGVSRDTFYRYQELVETNGLEALINQDRRVPNLKNRVNEATERAVVGYAIECPAHGQHRTSNELRKRGVFVSGSGVRSICDVINWQTSKTVSLH